jgi:hypothetical protein
MNRVPVQVAGLLFVADPSEDSLIEAHVNVLGILQVEIEAHVGEPMTVEITIPEGLASLTITFEMPSNSFLCKMRRQDAETEAKWHVLATLSRS